MSELHDEIQNLSAGQASPQPGSRVAQRPVLRLVRTHLRLLAQLPDKRDIAASAAARQGTGPAGAPAFACRASEVPHVRQ